MSLWPAGVGLSKPDVSNLNPAAGQTVANAAITLVGPDGLHIYNLAGSTDAVIDVVGTFIQLPTASVGNAFGPAAVRAATPRIYGSFTNLA